MGIFSSGGAGDNESGRGFKLDTWFLKLQFGYSMRMRIYEKIAKFVSNGVPLPQILDTMYLHLSKDGKTPKATGAVIITRWRQLILNGRSLAETLRGWVPDSDLSIIEAGELAGRLDKALEDVIFVNQANKKMKGAVWGMAYPGALIAIVFFYFYIFGYKVVPAFASVLPTSKWEGGAHYMASMSSWVMNQMHYWILGFFIIIIVISSTMGVWTGKLRSRFDEYPPWSIYRLVGGCNFLISMASLLKAGVPMPDSLKIMAKAGSPWYKQRVNATRRAVLDGALNVGEALGRTGYKFPDEELIIDIRSYASLEGFDDMLEKLARQVLVDSVAKIEGQIGIVKNIALAVLGVVFILLVSGVFALEMQITKSVGH